MTQGTPEPPEHLSEAAKQVWRAFAEQYRITIPDIPVYEHFCDSYARYQELMKKVNDVGAIVTIKGEACTNPNLARADKEATNFKNALALLMRMRHGRSDDADDEEADETPQAEAKNLEDFRAKLLDLITAGSDDDEGPAGDRSTTRPRKPADKSKPKTKKAAPRSVCKEKRPRAAATKKQKREE